MGGDPEEWDRVKHAREFEPRNSLNDTKGKRIKLGILTTTRRLGGRLVDCRRQPEGRDEWERASQITRIKTDTEKGHAGMPGARAGGVFAGPLTSELADGPSKTPLHSLRE